MIEPYNKNTFYLVRHGESENNVERILDAENGVPLYHLTERGRGQIVALAEKLQGEKIDFIVSSPVNRAKETAEMLRDALGAQLSFDERLSEAKVGSFEDQSFDLFLDYMKEHGGRLHGLKVEGIEGYQDIRARVRSCLADVSEHFEGKRIAIVSHGDPLQEMYGELLGLPSQDAELGDGWYPKTGSCLEIGPEGERELVD